jgi:hypothetical protein
LASFPDEAVNETRAKEIPYLTSNPIFRKAVQAAGGRVRVGRVR